AGAVVQQAHALEIGAAPCQSVLDLAAWPVAVEHGLLLLGETFRARRPARRSPRCCPIRRWRGWLGGWATASQRRTGPRVAEPFAEYTKDVFDGNQAGWSASTSMPTSIPWCQSTSQHQTEHLVTDQIR